jgi:hypothetical protein
MHSSEALRIDQIFDPLNAVKIVISDEKHLVGQITIEAPDEALIYLYTIFL